jgi:mannosylfructose-phosphate synthase
MEKKDFKNICMLSTHGYFDPVPQLGRTDTGGQVVYVLELAKAIARKGIKVDIYTRWFDKTQMQIDPVPDNPDVRVIRIPAGPWEFIPKEKIYDVLPELINNMEEFIKKHNIDYDLYHGHYVDAGIVTIEIAKRFSKPAYFTAHSLGAWKRSQMGGDPEKMEEKFNFKHRISEEMRIFKAVNAQTVTSEVQLEKLFELYDFKADNIENIPPGVDIHSFNLPDPDVEPIKTELPENYIFCLSRIDTNKGHDLLLDAFDIIRKEITDIQLVIGGGSPNPKPRELELLDKINKIIEEKGMQDRVVMTGYVPDELMAPYYQQSRIFVMPSLFEPFGMTTQEAMACGKTVVASKYGGIRNVIEDGVNGILVDPRHTEEFAARVIEVLKDEKMNNSIGKKANEIIVEKFSWEAIAERFLEFFEEYG